MLRGDRPGGLFHAGCYSGGTTQGMGSFEDFLNFSEQFSLCERLLEEALSLRERPGCNERMIGVAGDV